ncbi:competence protein ComK [Peribacillus frigoritolerans]|uniref:competence protein ComK n=1 Tax=Peribacillus castrilensis TaxID=2897690 RepID=UPI002DCF7FE5|nr:competence protein ComK [Peribacillus castrilensis]
MMIRKNYLLNMETVGMMERYDANGVEMTTVVEGDSTFHVRQPRQEILNNTLNHFGLDLDGGLVAAKSVLGGKYRLPVCINAQLGMVWFSSRSFRKRGGVWFSYIHIRDLEEMNEKETLVHTNYGHCLPVNLSKNQLAFKRDQAAYLHTTFHERSLGKKTFYYEPGSGITFCKEPGEVHYRVKGKE